MGMRTCLGILLLFFTIVAVVGTVVYNTEINTSLSFESKEAHADYINTHRSYRPPAPPDPTPTKAAEQKKKHP